MKKINSLVLSTITAAFLVGCGGGGGSSASTSSGTTTGNTTSTATDVTVERGPVYGATVTDANGQVAKAKSAISNVYTFATAPVYPITASGGTIDVDGNGFDEGDVELTTVLTSYSNVITPITTYLGDTKTDNGKVKLAKLKEISSVASESDLLNKVPSELSSDVLVLTNTLFGIMNDDDNINDDFLTDYDNSEFKTNFITLKTEADKYTDKKEIAKVLEEKVITDLGLTTITAQDITNNTVTSTTTLKIADLTRFVSYDDKNTMWYDDTTLSGNTLSFTNYDSIYSGTTNRNEWSLDSDDSGSITFTPDTTNPYKASYIEPTTKEEGTYTILSTKKVAGYSDLSVTKAQIKVSKKATDFNWKRWGWENPAYWDPRAGANVAVTDISGLIDEFVIGVVYFKVNETSVFLNSDGTIVNMGTNYSKGTTQVGTWKKEGDYVVATVGQETKYIRIILDNNKNYYVEESVFHEVGFTEYETIYTGSSLEDFITYIKQPQPVFTSSYSIRPNENQTALTTVTTDLSNVSYQLGTWGDAGSFDIDSSTGVITFKTAPDYEAKNYYNFQVFAYNNLNKNRASALTIYVYVQDVAETTPVVPR